MTSAVERAVREQDRAEHRLLGLEVVRGRERGRVPARLASLRRVRWWPRGVLDRGLANVATRPASDRRSSPRQLAVSRERGFAGLARSRESLRASCRSDYLLDDHRLDGRGDAVLDLDDDHVRADVPDRLLEVDLAPVDLDAARLADRVGDVLRGDRAEQAAVVAGLLR